MKKATVEKIEETIVTLCDWIQQTANKQTSSEELAFLPEVVEATAELSKVLIGYVHDRLMRASSHRSYSWRGGEGGWN